VNDGGSERTGHNEQGTEPRDETIRSLHAISLSCETAPMRKSSAERMLIHIYSCEYGLKVSKYPPPLFKYYFDVFYFQQKTAR
jgi:hypothetical protein